MRKLKLIFPFIFLFIGSFAFSLERGQAAWPPDSAYVNGVVGHPQYWPLSCESRAASDFAAFFGYTVSEAEIMAYVTQAPRTDNPNYGFVGDPWGAWGQIPPNPYGVHSNPIENALVSYGMPVYGERNLTWDFLRSEIASGRPVIVWIIGAMWPGEQKIYIDTLGRTAIVAAYEHTVILIGYNATTVWVVDAYDGLTKSYPVSSFLTSWGVLQNQGLYFHVDDSSYTNKIYLPLTVGSGEAVANEAAKQETTPAKPADVPASYFVQAGDTLGKIAYNFGIPWEQLAQFNGLYYPFTLYPGQEIRLQP